MWPIKFQGKSNQTIVQIRDPDDCKQQQQQHVSLPGACTGFHSEGAARQNCYNKENLFL